MSETNERKQGSKFEILDETKATIPNTMVGGKRKRDDAEYFRNFTSVMLFVLTGKGVLQSLRLTNF